MEGVGEGGQKAVSILREVGLRRGGAWWRRKSWKRRSGAGLLPVPREEEGEGAERWGHEDGGVHARLEGAGRPEVAR